ncbi:MAG: hypothetical protein MI863_14520 [Desulfobacterales bacterium]|nr:hypothetical protein [Desulfobacterales bacterium]
MSESNDLSKRKKTYKRGVVPFYGALKSKNEVYFQMASLFKEVTKGDERLSGQWIDRMLASRQPNSPGKIFMDNI